MDVMRFIAAAALLAAALPAARADDAKLGKADFLGQIVLPTGLKIAGVEFGGISGLDYDGGNDLFYAISDDRSEKAPATTLLNRPPSSLRRPRFVPDGCA